jgi:hypothetical protein
MEEEKNIYLLFVFSLKIEWAGEDVNKAMKRFSFSSSLNEMMMRLAAT